MKNLKGKIVLSLTLIAGLSFLPVAASQVADTNSSLNNTIMDTTNVSSYDMEPDISTYSNAEQITYTNDSGASAWSTLDAKNRDSFFAITPSGHYVDIFYTDANWTMTWDPSEISNIEITEYILNSSISLKWTKQGPTTIPGTSGTLPVGFTDKQFYVIESRDIAGDFIETDIVIQSSVDPYNLFEEGTGKYGTQLFIDFTSIPIKINEPTTGLTLNEELKTMTWVEDWLYDDYTNPSDPKKGSYYNELAQYKGYPVDSLYNASASEARDIVDDINSYYDLSTINTAALNTYVDSQLQSMYNPEDIYGLPTSTIEADLDNIIYTYIENNSPDTSVDSSDITIGYTWLDNAGVDNTVIGESMSLDVDLQATSSGDWILTTLAYDPLATAGYNYSMSWPSKPAPVPPTPVPPVPVPPVTNPTTSSAIDDTLYIIIGASVAGVLLILASIYIYVNYGTVRLKLKYRRIHILYRKGLKKADKH
ncbi:MAG: hypothetical protein HRS57_00735 [Mycoplasmataceae bacterium]|nr:hypothetical protein [Mycoplasmataceae bacterium]